MVRRVIYTAAMTDIEVSADKVGQTCCAVAADITEFRTAQQQQVRQLHQLENAGL